MRELCSENEGEFKKVKESDSSLGTEKKVILLECDVFLSYIFVEQTYNDLDYIQAVNCRVSVVNICYALDYNRSTSLHRSHEYALAAENRAS